MRLLVLAALVAAAPAAAASLRGATILSDPAVRLSDLFDGVEHDRAIGPGPEPGNHIIVEAAQLAAIARQFDVDWHPANQADHIVLERPGRPIPREDVLTALRASLADAGAPVDTDIDLPGFTPPMAPAGVAARADVGQLDYDRGSGRFAAVLSVTAATMAPVHVRLAGQVTEMVDLPVAAHRILPGTVITPADIQRGRVRATALRGEPASTAAQAAGMAPRRTLSAGDPLLLAELVRPDLVQKGETVHMRLDSPGIAVTAQGVAMAGGGLGERIRVLNPASRALLDADIEGPGQVRVTGSAPVPLPPGAAVPARLASR